MNKNIIFLLLLIITFLTTGLSSNSSSLKALKECSPTTSDYLGPYYVANIPEKEDLLDSKIKGEEVVIKGKVFDYKTFKPIGEVIVDIWHAGPNANYWPENNGSYADYDKKELKFRGKSISDEEGNFSFKTVLPGRYDSRPVRHYHFKIMHKEYQTLITQIYDKRDKELMAKYSLKKTEDCRLFSITNNREIKVNFFLQ